MSTATWVDDDDQDDAFPEFGSIDALNAEDERITAQMDALGSKVDRGDKEATREYLSLAERQMELVDERIRRRRGKQRPSLLPPHTCQARPRSATSGGKPRPSCPPHGARDGGASGIRPRTG
jgi:hypothetical protein